VVKAVVVRNSQFRMEDMYLDMGHPVPLVSGVF
jgi:hypothetical protein